MNNSILITGCAGFIGSHAVDHFLAEGYNVIGVDLLTYAGNMMNLDNAITFDSFSFIKEDICNTAVIKNICIDNNVDWIFNFAAETHVDNSIDGDLPFFHSNILGVRSLATVCRETNAKIFHISTDEVYGSTESGSFKETDAFAPRNPYSATKAAGEHIINSYSNTYGIDFIIVRPSNNFGPRQNCEKFLPTIVKSLSSGSKVPIYGDGKNVRDWLYVKDNIRIIYEIWKKSDLNSVYNISLLNEIENIDIVKKIVDMMNLDYDSSVMFIKDRPGHDFRYSISNVKISNIDINLQTDFEKNLKHTIKCLLEAK
jgi:dTDP-glucose 4,6-dehydratase